MTTRESPEEGAERDFLRDLFAAADSDDMPTPVEAALKRASVEDVRPDSHDTAEREFIRALFDSNSDEN